jgi:hypothetical protein
MIYEYDDNGELCHWWEDIVMLKTNNGIIVMISMIGENWDIEWYGYNGIYTYR